MLKRAMPMVFGFGLLMTTVLLLMPSYVVPREVDLFDKLLHGLMFTALALAGLFAYPQRIKTVVWGLVLYGGLMEVCQSQLTTTRHGDLLDWGADTLGVMLGFVVYLGCKKSLNLLSIK